MLSGGDEFRRTQNGNNNAYCQDNETSWYDWALVARNAALVRFVSRLGSLRRAHPVLATDRFYTSAEIQWLGTDGFAPGWDGHHNRVGCMIREQEGGALCLLFNATTDTVRFALPSPPSGRWRIALDTSRAAPDDAPGEPARELLPDRRHARVAARSVMVVVSA
jgi:isoamylase